MTLEATYEVEFELLDLDNLCSHVSLAPKRHNLQNVGTDFLLTKCYHQSGPIPGILAECAIEERTLALARS